jgi:ATP-dependent Clp protease ATP-binding subunit ClpA
VFERFSQEARAIVEGAQGVATELGSPSIEAEHLLLAAARQPGGPLARTGLDYDGVLDALELERTRSLAAIGISLEPPPAAPELERPVYSTSAKVALQRALQAAVARRDKRIRAGHVVLGVLSAQRGTVPRALDCAGLDRAVLIAAVEAG